MIDIKDRKVDKTNSINDYIIVDHPIYGTQLYSTYSKQIVPLDIVNLLKTRWEVTQ